MQKNTAEGFFDTVKNAKLEFQKNWKKGFISKLFSLNKYWGKVWKGSFDNNEFSKFFQMRRKCVCERKIWRKCVCVCACV